MTSLCEVTTTTGSPASSAASTRERSENGSAITRTTSRKGATALRTAIHRHDVDVGGRDRHRHGAARAQRARRIELADPQKLAVRRHAMLERIAQKERARCVELPLDDVHGRGFRRRVEEDQAFRT